MRRADEIKVIKKCLEDHGFWRRVINKSPLYPYQIKIIELVKSHILGRTGRTLTIRLPRQTGKNEIAAELQKWAFLCFQKEGGIYIRTAPTYKPQIVNSKLRLEKTMRGDPLFRGSMRPREGFMYEYGNVLVKFLSTDDKASVVGDTASICLDLDEAHKVSEDKYREDFSPMCGSKSTPVVMFGVGANKLDLLYKTRQQNEYINPEFNMQVSVEECCEANPHYAKHYAEQVRILGEDHPVILTQYRLVDVESIGGFFSPKQVKTILSGDHPRISEPKDGRTYYACIDIAGEDELETDGLEDALAGKRDATVCLIFDVDLDNKVNGHPVCKIVQSYVWVGKQFQGDSRGLGQQELLLKALKKWRCVKTVVDARGIGESMAAYLSSRHYGVERYRATAESVSSDCYGALAMVNNDCLRMWQRDGSTEWSEFRKELQWTGKEIHRGDKIKLIKPSQNKHIDMVKAATYIYRLVKEENEINIRII